MAWDDVFVMEPTAVEWVPIDMAWGWHWDVQIRLAKLLDAQIPATLDTRPNAEMFGWFFGSLFMIRILVPPTRAEEARALLDTGCDDPEFGEAAEAELREMWDEWPWYRFTRRCLRAYAYSYVAAFAIGYLAGAVNAVLDLLHH